MPNPLPLPCPHGLWMPPVMEAVLNAELIPIFDLYIPITFLINTAIQYDTNNTYYNYIITRVIQNLTDHERQAKKNSMV